MGKRSKNWLLLFSRLFFSWSLKPTFWLIFWFNLFFFLFGLFRLVGYMVQWQKISWLDSRCSAGDGDQYTACHWGLLSKGQLLSTCQTGCTKFFDGLLDRWRFSWVGIALCGMDLEAAASNGSNDLPTPTPLSILLLLFPSLLIVLFLLFAFLQENSSFLR